MICSCLPLLASWSKQVFCRLFSGTVTVSLKYPVLFLSRLYWKVPVDRTPDYSGGLLSPRCLTCITFLNEFPLTWFWTWSEHLRCMIHQASKWKIIIFDCPFTLLDYFILFTLLLYQCVVCFNVIWPDFVLCMFVCVFCIVENVCF